MTLTETFNTKGALTTLRLINKARQCAKRGDETGMFDHTEQAYIERTCAPIVLTADTGVANIIAAKVTHKIYTLYLIARKGKCETFVRHTKYLACDVHELVDAMQGERKHGI